MRRWFALLLIVVLVPIAFGALVTERKDFYNNLWAPAHLLLIGQSPYDTTTLNADLPPLWLPMAIGAFAPLGWLSEEAATQVWFLFTVALMAGLIHMSLPPTIPTPAVAAAGLLAFFFPPVLNHMLLGQFSVVAAFCLVLAARWLEEGRQWPAAFLLALAAAKPQLSVLPAIGLAAGLASGAGPRGVAVFGAKVLAAAAALSAPVILLAPQWFTDYRAGWEKNPNWHHPSSFYWLHEQLGGFGWLLWAALIAGAVIGCIAIGRRLKPQTAIAWTLAITVLVIPYLWSWDFVLLLPLWLLTFGRSTWGVRLLLFAAYAIGWAGMAYVQLAHEGLNALYWWVPWWFAGSTLLVDGRQLLQGMLTKDPT